MTFSLSTTVVSDEGERLYTFESAASIAQTSIAVIEIYVQLGVIEPVGSMLHSREIARIAQIQVASRLGAESRWSRDGARFSSGSCSITRTA
jgi:hypothetical protein